MPEIRFFYYFFGCNSLIACYLVRLDEQFFSGAIKIFFRAKIAREIGPYPTPMAMLDERSYCYNVTGARFVE